MEIVRNVGFLILIVICGGHLQAQTGTSGADAKPDVKKDIIGSWKSDEAVVEFVNNKVVTINKQKYAYAIVGKTLVVGNDQGQVEMPFALKDDTLVVLFEGRKVVYKRMTDDEIADAEKSPAPTPRTGGSVPQELAGKWCYLFSFTANNGGGRQSERCVTLFADGTYRYHAETSMDNPYGGSNSQTDDYGRWTATANSLTAYSSSGKTVTYTLEKRNHPKNGDPMLMIDGDAFATATQRPSWR